MGPFPLPQNRNINDANIRAVNDGPQPLSAGGITLFDLAAVPVTRYRYRGAIPSPWDLQQPA